MNLLSTKNHQLKTDEKGFTLIELLVVIAIIGMLSSVVLASMNTARKKARDARRMTDAKALQTALELVYDDGNTYPVAAAPITITDTSTVGVALVGGAISKIPLDSTYSGVNGYRYAATDPVHGYAIAIQKEQSGWCQFSEGTGFAAWNVGGGSTIKPCTAR